MCLRIDKSDRLLANDAAAGNISDLFTIENLGLDDDAPDQVERVSFSTTAISYTPPAGATTESFTYEISDGTTERREALITITVIDAFPAIEAEDDAYFVAKNSSGHTLDVLLNDSSFPVVGWNRTITTVDPLASGGGSVSINGGNTLTYSPIADFYGEEDFDYTIKDAFGQTSTATVTVAVGMLITSPDACVVLENSQDNPFTVLLNDDILNRYAADYVISGATVPALSGTVSVDGAGPNNQLLYTPEAHATGTVEITYTVTDQTGGEATESAFVEIISEESDRAVADLVIRVTGINDAPVLGGTEDDQITDKESTFPFDTVTLSDVDENGDQTQTVTINFDAAHGELYSNNILLSTTGGEYVIVGTPAEVVAALRLIEFRPFENLIPLLDPGYFDSVFTLTITDGDLVTPIVDETTVRVFAENDAPNNFPDLSSDVANDTYGTFENQTIRLLEDATLLSTTFDFGDLTPDWWDTDAMGDPALLLPELRTPHLLDNDFDVDIDNDTNPLDGGLVDLIPTIEIVNVHQTATRVDQITATSALGASVVLDIRAVRAETNILYDPRGSTILNALRARETIVDTFYYTVIDQHGAEDQVLVSVTVTGVNDVPTANSDSGYELTEDGVIIIPGSEVLSNDTDPDQDNNTPDDMPIIVDFPALSQLGATLGFDGTDITYNPDDMEQYESLARNEFITDTITYTISDEEGGTSQSTIELEVEGLNDTPVAVADALPINENDTRTRDRASGLISNDSDVDMGISFNSDQPNDDPWILPQRTQTSPLGAAFTIETDGSYSYDANSRVIDSLFENEIAVETFPYVIIDNSRLSAAPDSYKVVTNSQLVVLPVLSNDDVAGSVPVAIEGFTADLSDSSSVIVESFEHPLREGMLIKIQGYVGDADYDGVYPINVVDRDHFSVEAPYVDGALTTLGTWRPWFEVTAVITLSEADPAAVLAISEDGQSILYTPIADFYGSEQFEYTIQDGVGGQDVAIAELTVLQAPLNTVLSASDDFFQIGKGETSVEVDVLVNDNILPALGSAFTITDASAGSQGGSVVISGANILIYTPVDTDFVGTETFTYDMSGGGSSTAQATVTFEVIDRLNYLNASPDAFFVVQDTVGNLLDVAANDASLPSFPVSFEVVEVSVPTSGTATVASGQVSYTPNASFVGSDTFDYIIRDASGGYVSASVEVEVVPNVDDFFARNDHYIIVAGTGEYQLPVLLNDGVSGANSPALRIEDLGLDDQAPDQVARVTFTDTVVNYTVPSVIGTETFNYEIEDGTEQRREAIITITVVESLPTLPNALDDEYHVAKNSADHRLDVLLNDNPLPLAEWAWTITAVSSPNQGGEATIDAGAAINYSPAAGFYGVESFTYTIEDELGAEATATVTATVGAQLTEPDVYVVLENSTGNDFPVLGNDDILERFAADYTISAFGPTDNGGVVTIAGSGPNNQLLYAPAADFIGEETFTYTVIDQTGAEMTETVTVVIIEENADRDFANFVVTLTGINDITNIANTPDGSTTDKLSVKPFPSVAVTDLDEDDLQDQITTVAYDASFGSLSVPSSMSMIGTGTYQITGTPAEVTIALRLIVFTPYENFIDYIDYGLNPLIGDVAFTLSIDDLNLGPVLGDNADAAVVAIATINVEPINDDPTIMSVFSDWVLPVNSEPRARLLTPHFADVDDEIAASELVWTVSSDNPSLFDSISVDAAKQLLVVDFATDQFGVAVVTVRATDRGLLFVETSFTVTIQGPHVLDLEVGETRPAAAVEVNSGFFNDRYIQSFRVTNEGPLSAEAFIVHLTDFDKPGLTLENAGYSSDENVLPNNFATNAPAPDDVTSLSVVESSAYSVKFDVPLAAGESTVVHFEYQLGIDTSRTIRPLVEIEWARSSGSGSMMLIDSVQDAQTGEFELTFVTEAGRSYQLEYSSNLSTWLVWAEPMAVSEFDTIVGVTDDGLNTETHPSLASTRFYRLVDITPLAP